MHAHCLTFSLFALLTSAAASPHETTSLRATAAGKTKTVVVSTTHTLNTSVYPLPSAEASLTCPTSNVACIIDGIAIWPNSTTHPTVPVFTFDPVTSATSMEASLSSATPPETRNVTKSACTPKHSSFTTFPSPSLSQPSTSLTENTISCLNMNTPTPTTNALAPSRPRTIRPYSFDPVAWAPIPHPHAKRSSNATQRRLKRSSFFVAALPQKHQQIVHDEDEDAARPQTRTKHQQIVRDEDEDEEYHRVQRLKEADEKSKEDGCVTCEKGRSLVCVNGTHYGHCDEGCAEPRRLGEGMECVDGRVFGVRMWREE
jgi:hypothetical protein